MTHGVNLRTVYRAGKEIGRGIRLLRVTIRKRLQDRRDGTLHGSVRRGARGGFRLRRRR